MATKSKNAPAAKAEPRKTVAEQVAPAANATLAETQSGDRRVLMSGGIAAEDLEVLSGTIDQRMKALLADHKEMGARPK